MKVKIGTWSVLQDKISINATCPLEYKSQINTGDPCTLHMGEYEIRGNIRTNTEKAQHIHLLIKADRRKDYLNVLYDHQNNNSVILVTNNSSRNKAVDPELYQKTQQALLRLSQIRQMEQSELLKELTAFGTHAGKTDLNTVSQNQMVIVLEKARHAIQHEQPQAQAPSP